MALIVQKYGGSSVATTEHIKKIANKIKKFHDEGNQLVIVVSAMSGETNKLIELAKEITDAPAPREMDVLVSTGEQVTIALLSMALQGLGIDAKSYTGSQVRILTDNVHSKARIKEIDDARVHADLNANRIVVIAGFQGVDEQGSITTLGRGGSDTTAVAMAAALNADECQIYTDVDGVYTTDPRIEPNARKLDRITFEEMLEMASLGSKVLQIRSVEFAGKYNVPLRVLSSFNEGGQGTLITYEDENMEAAQVSGIAFSRNEAKLTIKSIPDEPGIASKIIGPIANANIEIDMIVQNISQDEAANFTFTVDRNDYERALVILKQTANRFEKAEVSGDNTIVKLSLVGVGMRSHAGIASKMFDTLAEEGINIRMISTSEIKISVVIDEKYLELGIRALHLAFGLDKGA